MFLTDINFKKQLQVDNTKSSYSIFGKIEEKLKKLKVDKILVTDNHLNFKNSLFNGQSNWHLMAMVGSGYFDYNLKTSIVTYRISILRTFIFSLIASCVFALFSSSVYVGLLVFFWFYGMNRIISTARHKKFFNELAKEIESETCDIKCDDSFVVK